MLERSLLERSLLERSLLERGLTDLKKVRIRYCFHGEVQGVGFRYTAKQVADYYGLTGFVKNEYDGSVTAEVQGTPLDVVAFVPGITRASRWIHIESFEKKEVPLKEDERSFSVVGF
ncbi:acylphosphatase [Lachnospiraceae bacterium YH-ros2226]